MKDFRNVRLVYYCNIILLNTGKSSFLTSVSFYLCRMYFFKLLCHLIKETKQIYFHNAKVNFKDQSHRVTFNDMQANMLHAPTILTYLVHTKVLHAKIKAKVYVNIKL